MGLRVKGRVVNMKLQERSVLRGALNPEERFSAEAGKSRRVEPRYRVNSWVFTARSGLRQNAEVESAVGVYIVCNMHGVASISYVFIHNEEK